MDHKARKLITTHKSLTPIEDGDRLFDKNKWRGGGAGLDRLRSQGTRRVHKTELTKTTAKIIALLSTEEWEKAKEVN